LGHIRKWILLGLLVPAVGLVAVQIMRPDARLELLCLVYAVPVIVDKVIGKGYPICQTLRDIRLARHS
jgi:hypothetical protein